MACNNQSSLFGASEKYIKFLNGDLVGIEGINTIERQFLKDLRIPYTQLLKGRIVLKAGQVDYLMNHLGLGDNATFVSIAATYDPKSKIEEDNYVQFNYYNNLTSTFYFDQLLILTGNSTHRIPQLYLTNPNPTYPVTLEVMVANIDDTYNFFNDTINQTATSFTGLELQDFHSYFIGETIVVNDKSNPPRPLIYFRIANISSLERDGSILIIDDLSKGTIFFKFKTEGDALQTFSLLNYVLENPDVNIDTLITNNIFDNVAPIITFNTRVGGTGDYIYDYLGNTQSLPDTTGGNTFSTSISISTFGVGGELTKNNLYGLLINNIYDNRDGIISGTGSNLNITSASSSFTSITVSGTYSLNFDISDIAENITSNVVLNLTINS